MSVTTTWPAEPATPPDGVPYRLTTTAFYRMIDTEIISAGHRLGLPTP